MKKITLIFPNEKLLWALIETLQSKPLDITAQKRNLPAGALTLKLQKH